MSYKITQGKKKSMAFVVAEINDKDDVISEKKVSYEETSELEAELTWLSKAPEKALVYIEPRRVRFMHLARNMPIWKFYDWKTLRGTEVMHKDLWVKVFKRIVSGDLVITNLFKPEDEIERSLTRAAAFASAYGGKFKQMFKNVSKELLEEL